MNISKKIRIICEEASKESPYCKQVLAGLYKEIKKRRYSYIELFEAHKISCEDIVYIVGLSHSWSETMIQKCNAQGCTPIVMSNCSKRVFTGIYHYICTGMYDVMKKLYEACLGAGRTSIALYGVDHTSDSDNDKMQIFSTLVRDNGKIYFNTGNLEACFQTFYPYAEKHDAVVCVNGYAAVSLVRKLEKVAPKILDKIVVISCEEVLRYSKYNNRILFLDLNFDSFGATGIQIADMIQSMDHVLEITVSVKGIICEIPEKVIESEVSDIRELYEDPELVCMARIDQLMRDADDMDHHIIAMLLSNAKYSEIADSCYMTEGNVKYRVKKYMSICDCKTKKELLELLQEYLQ